MALDRGKFLDHRLFLNSDSTPHPSSIPTVDQWLHRVWWPHRRFSSPLMKRRMLRAVVVLFSLQWMNRCQADRQVWDNRWHLHWFFSVLLFAPMEHINYWTTSSIELCDFDSLFSQFGISIDQSNDSSRFLLCLSWKSFSSETCHLDFLWVQSFSMSMSLHTYLTLI